MKFCLLDASNLVHRAKHAVSYQQPRAYQPGFGLDQEEAEADFAHDDRVGLILNTVFTSLKKSYERFGAQHCVACFDSRSWRRDVRDDYKANRREKQRTPKEQREHELINYTIDTFRDFLKSSTNVTVLEASRIEADDFIARWVQLHHHDEFQHIIISADGDFKQLVRPGVDLFVPIGKSQTLYTSRGIFYQDGRKAAKGVKTDVIYGEYWKVQVDKKTGEPVTFDPKWELFEKCIRGDTSDNIMSAWPRVPTAKMQKAFYGDIQDWNNFINSTWGEGENKVSVRERYEENKRLIDLTAQPEEIKELIDLAIEKALDREHRQMVGAYFAQFCAKHGLSNLAKQASAISTILSSPYD